MERGEFCAPDWSSPMILPDKLDWLQASHSFHQERLEPRIKCVRYISLQRHYWLGYAFEIFWSRWHLRDLLTLNHIWFQVRLHLLGWYLEGTWWEQKSKGWKRSLPIADLPLYLFCSTLCGCILQALASHPYEILQIARIGRGRLTHN